MEVRRLQVHGADNCLPCPFISRIVAVRIGPLRIWIYSDVLVREHRQSMGPGIVEERAVVIIGIFQSNPDTNHEAFRTAAEMDAIAVEMLLRSNWEIQRLEWYGTPAVKVGKQLQDGWIAGNLFDF